VTLTDSHSVASISGLKPVTVTGDLESMAGLPRIRRQRVAKGNGLDDGAQGGLVKLCSCCLNVWITSVLQVHSYHRLRVPQLDG